MKIEVRGREICQSNNCIGLQADNNVEIRDFVLSRYYGDIDLSEGIAYLLFCDPSGRTGYIPLEKTVAEDSLNLRWIVGSELTAVPGQIKAQIKISGLDAALWHSEVAYFHVAESIPAESPQPVVFSTRAAMPRTSSLEAEPPITISERKINIPAVLQNIAVQNDENSETVTIQMPRFFDGHDLSEHIIILKTVSSGGRDDIVFSDVAVGDSELTFQWTLRPPQTSYNGTLTLQLRVEGKDFKWETDTATVNILRSIDAQPVIPSTPSILDGFAARLETAEQNAQSALDGLAGKVDKVMGARLMTNEEAEKLSGLHNYILPTAGNELGGVKNGGNVTVNADGTMTAPEGGGSDGAVESVNGKTGAVTLTAADVSALSKTAQAVTNWDTATNTGLYTSDLTAQNLPDMETDSSGGVCNGLTINDAQFIMCSDYSMMNIWAGYRHYMGSGYFTEWTQFLSSSSGFSAITVTDWNNATQTGFYTSNADADNAPYPYTYDTCFGFVIANTSAAQQFVFRESKASNGIVDNALYTRSVRLNSRPVYYGEWQLVNKQAAADVPITAISGMTATTVQEALEENFQSVVDGKSSLETAITDKGGTVSKTGDVATFAELTAGVGTISGGGSSEDYVNMLKRDSASVVIPTETTALGDRVFYNWSTLTSISGWDNVNAIGEYTFNGCTVFAPDKLPDNLTSIGRSAFQRCTALAITALPENLATIGDYAFEVCTALALTNLPDGLTEIPQSAFASCPNLALTSLPAGLTAIKNRAFQYDTNLALTSLPAGITQLDAYTFQNCTSLKITSLPDALTTIGSMVFAGCTGLTSITIGPNVTSIVTTAFSGCTNLTQITCGFAQGAVSGAPWGATNANITYVLL